MYYRICLLAGIAALTLSLVILKHSLDFVDRSERATGTVVKLDTITGGDAGTTYVPVFSIITKDNEEIIYPYHSSSSPPSWTVGETEKFLYDPQDPSSVRAYTYFGVFSWSIVLTSAAILLITFGGSYFVLRRYWR